MDYAIGAKVLCYHGPLLYEAKVTVRCWIMHRITPQVLGVDKHQSEPLYYVHYRGWKQKYELLR